MFPFASLPANLAAFGAMLRDRYGFRVGPRHLHDAALALRVIQIADERAVRDALRPIFCGRLEESTLFDGAFDRFFRGNVPATNATAALPEREPTSDEKRSRQSAVRLTAVGDAVLSADAGRPEAAATPVAVHDAETDDAAGLVRSTYSPMAAEGEPPLIGPVDRLWRDAAAALVRRVQIGLSRTWKPALRGHRFDLRRTLRASLHTGGEAVLPRWRVRPKRAPRFLVIVDGSRSMAASAATALRMAVALASVTARVEVFAFSTALRRITPDVKRAAAGALRRPRHLHHAWGGGTGIGRCLQSLVREHADRIIGRETVVLVASDGLDVGRPDVLRAAMADLRRRSAAVVWLNPLLDTRGYEPSAAGMRAARPFVSTFAWARDPPALHRVARQLRIRR